MSLNTLAWGAKVSGSFCDRVLEIAACIGVDPSWLMAIMAFESGLNPARRNATSGATGLIQFMPSTARLLNTTTDALAAMDAVAQLDYVERYFLPYTGRLSTLSDAYMAVLWPKAIGEPDGEVIFGAGSQTFLQNCGLDLNHDGEVTKAECAAFVRHKLDEGWLPLNQAQVRNDGCTERRRVT
jgi:hypothetical protein